MACAAQKCLQGRISCTRTECGYVDPITFAGEEPEEFTQAGWMKRILILLDWIPFFELIGVALAAFLLYLAIVFGPVMVASLN